MPEQFEAFNTLKEQIDDNATKESLQELHDKFLEHVESDEVTESSVEDKITIIENELNELGEKKEDLKTEIEAYKDELEDVVGQVSEALNKLEDEVKQQPGPDELPEDATIWEQAAHFFKKLKSQDWRSTVGASVLGIASLFTFFGPQGKAMYNKLEEGINKWIAGTEDAEDTERTEEQQEKIDHMNKEDLVDLLETRHEDNFKHDKHRERLPLMSTNALRLIATLLAEEKFQHLRITSTLRAKDENEQDGGVHNSKHLVGLGFDVGRADSSKSPTYTLKEVKAFIDEQYDGSDCKTLIHGQGNNEHLHVEFEEGEASSSYATEEDIDEALTEVA